MLNTFFCDRTMPIGVFDSGVGGISVLKKLIERLPSESYIYYSDRNNAPYGKLSENEISEYTTSAVNKLISLGCKAIVIACNTATAVAAERLRAKNSIPIIGIEPALRPAEAAFPNGSILLLATPVTLRGSKFQSLYRLIERGNVTCVSAPELVRFVESGRANGLEAISYLKALLADHAAARFDACVLGCTHFPFAKRAVCAALGYEPCFFDGADGAARRLEAELKRYSIENTATEKGVVFWNEIYPAELQNKLMNSK